MSRSSPSKRWPYDLKGVGDWYRYVTSIGDLTSGLLIGYDNNTFSELDEQAHSCV